MSRNNPRKKKQIYVLRKRLRRGRQKGKQGSRKEMLGNSTKFHEILMSLD